MRALIFSIVTTMALAACGGRLDETGTGVDEDDSMSTDLQAQELRGQLRTELDGRLRHPFALPEQPRVALGEVVPVGSHRDQPLVPAELRGVTPVLEFDFSHGRIEARLTTPDFARDHLYSVEHQGGQCHH